ncbi:hypothetical protein A2U01_0095935 [Trifolium medium]|uniref:Uncharacterized protein n=1 Tax=Trifolium medium TaxID=97028 RepID=A0A392UM83_9FABA|nr:hypothetical protein [Trifolium medium]
MKLAMSANHGLCEMENKCSSGNSSVMLLSLAVIAALSSRDK